MYFYLSGKDQLSSKIVKYENKMYNAFQCLEDSTRGHKGPLCQKCEGCKSLPMSIVRVSYVIKITYNEV